MIKKQEKILKCSGKNFFILAKKNKKNRNKWIKYEKKRKNSPYVHTKLIYMSYNLKCSQEEHERLH